METLILSAQTPPNPLRRASPHRRPQYLRFRRHIVAASENLPSETTQISEPKPKSENRMFILGTGYVPHFVAADFKKKGWDIQRAYQFNKNKKHFQKLGYGAHLFNTDMPLTTLNAIKGCTHLLVSLPVMPGYGDPMLEHKELLRREIKNGDLKWLCYLSSTNVYGDHGGAWVDEDSTTNLVTEEGKMIVAMEEEWLKIGHGLGLSSFAFRIGAIYGPDRSAVDTVLKDGPFTEGDLMRFSNQYYDQVHIEDLCQALEASTVKPSDRNLFNIVDDDPTPTREVIAYAQDLVHKRWPGRVRSPIPIIQERNTERGNRVSNARMKNELGVSLRYPSYIEGLQSLIDKMEDTPF